MNDPKDGSGQEVVHPAVAMAAGAIRAEEAAKLPQGPRRNAVPICGIGNPTTGFTCAYPEGHIGLHRGEEGEHFSGGTVKHDAVDHPSHYTDSPAKCSKCGHPIECIDVVQHWSFNLGNAGKYLWRQGKKLGVDATEDLRKSLWYINAEIKKLGGPK